VFSSGSPQAVEEEENGCRLVRLSELGRKIVQLPSDDPRRKEAIAGAAKKPTIHHDLLGEYPTGLPEDPVLHGMITTGTPRPGGSPPPPPQVEFFEYPIPEVRGYTATFRTPMPETLEDCAYIRGALNAAVDTLEKATARRLARQRERDEDS
jgi:hypothetical protein